MGKGVSRREKNTLDQRFRVVFAERLYDGAPRWYSRAWKPHVRRVNADRKGVLDREPGVNRHIQQAHLNSQLFRQDDTAYLWTCVNPDCKLRVQSIYTKGYIRRQRRGSRPRLNLTLYKGLKALAQGTPQKQPYWCDTCYERVRAFAADLIRHKWIYVLKQVGDQLEHYCEIFSEEPERGKIYTRIRNGRYLDTSSKPFPGYIHLLPHPTRYTWHFFLSPIRLGAEGLTLLSESVRKGAALAQARDQADPAKVGVPIDEDLQPWTPTVKRRFSAEQVRQPRREFVPLVDPFAWMAQAVDFDYLPILAAQQKLVRDSDEQAKAFIASVLQQAIGRRMTSKNPPEWEEDQWDIKDDTIDKPYGAKGSNVVEAWTERYKEVLTYLTEETNKACARLTYVLRYSLAHRIVELGCQDWGQERGFLSFGLMHWNHVLKELPACEEGQRFIAWLTGNGKGASDSPMKPEGRIPIKNVLAGEELRNDSQVSKEAGKGLPLYILSTLSGAVIARSNKPADAMVQHLANINIPAVSFQGSDLQGFRDLTLNISKGLLDNYVSKLPESADFKSAHRHAVASDWQKRLTLFERLSQFDNAASLLLAIKDYNKAGRTYESEYNRYSRVRGRVETPIKVADFLAKNARDLIKSNLSGNAASVVKRVDDEGVRVIARLSTAEYEALIASRSVQAYRMLGTGARILAGPVGLLLGGTEMVAQSMQTIDSWEAGDPGAAVGHGLQAAAGLLIIAVAGAECVALATGAAAAAWAGPVGWIAAGLMLLGSIVIAVWSKNDLELFALHCFVGEDYGAGDWDDETGKAWMTGKPWPWLRYDKGGREARDRWQRQRLALLRLISGFQTHVGPFTYCGGIVFPTHLSNAAFFEIEVDVMPQDQKSPKETFKALVWPKARGHVWIGRHPRSDSSIDFFPSRGDPVTSFEVQAKPRRIKAALFDYELRVRLDLDGGRRHLLPASGKFVTNTTVGTGIYETKSSSEVD